MLTRLMKSGEADSTEPPKTLIFVDVDGVLNVGVCEPGSKPISFNEPNVSLIRKLLRGNGERHTSDLLLSVMRMNTCDGNSSTYGDFLSRNDLDVCDIFVHRLVKILRSVEGSRQVIVSSAWRRPEYSANLKNLEKVISGYLGNNFIFDDCTALVDESAAGPARLSLIGEYITKYCDDNKTANIQILVLDDFFYSPVKGYNCGGTAVDSLEAAERFLKMYAPSTTETKVRIIHTQVSGALPSGQEVHVGTGLSVRHVNDALAFLRRPSDPPKRASEFASGGDTMLQRIPLSFASVGESVEVSEQPSPVPTLIFLDIDGVLNIGIKDIGGPLSFSEANYSIARKLLQGAAKSDTAAALLTVMRMPTGDGGPSTYGDFLSRNDLDVCDVFIHRFVKIIRAAGYLRHVVLSSSWRRPKYARGLKNLETIIGGYLCEPFEFDDRTALDNEIGGHDRLCLIGDYIESFCLRDPKPTKVKVIVLDDMYYSPIRDYNCRGTAVNSIKEAEAYLEARAPPTTAVGARIIHTQMSCSLPDGLEVNVGTGLSINHVGDAFTFLGVNQGSWGRPTIAAI